MTKKLLFLLTSFFISSAISAQVTPNQTDDFQDGTVQGWFESGASPNPPVNAADAGPMGVGDNCLRDDSDNSLSNNSPGARMVARNISQWTGDYSGQGIIAIKFDARAVGADLTFRVAMNGDGGSISSTTGVAVTTAAGWTAVVIPIAAADMVTVPSNAGSGFDVAATLANCSEFRILSNPVPSYSGEPILATMEIDNIVASTTLSNEAFFLSDSFKISPNPGSYNINIALNRIDVNSKIEVYDILGKRIYYQDISELNSMINVSQWKSGVYLVKLTTGNAVQTKRFIKQ